MALIFIAVIARILSNAASNVFQKRLTGFGVAPFQVNLVSYGALSVIGMFFLCANLPDELPMRYWIFSLLSGLTGALGNGFIVKALEKGELSVMGPINAYKPVVGMVTSFLLARELPNSFGLAGVALIILGSYFVLDATQERFSWTLLRNRAIQYRIAALLLTGIQAVIDKEIIRASNLGMAFFSWSFFGLLFTYLMWTYTGKNGTQPVGRSLRLHRLDYLLLVICTGTMVYSTNITFSSMPVGEALALFQLSGILTVYWGYRFFREGQLIRKLVGAGFMAAGAALILLHT
ncbi:MAG: EamA family transporter [bacterium]|jgi:drug/metabolite transporter (DMT)-like permease|nr:EamA family transporter [Chitinophagaceae bacterium]